MTRYLLPILLLIACDDGPTHAPWDPERAPVPDTAAMGAPVVPADCEGHLEQWQYRYEDGRLAEAARFGTEGARVETLRYDAEGRFVGIEMVGDRGSVSVTLTFDGAGRVVGRVVESSEETMDSRMEVVSSTPEETVIDYEGAVLFLPLNPAEGPSIPKAYCDALHDTGIRRDVMVEELVRRIDAHASYEDFSPFRVREVRRYDESGRLVRTTWDLRRDGRFDLVETVEHEALADGRRREVVRLARRGEPDATRVERTYDAADRLVREVGEDEARVFDWDGDELVGERRESPEGVVTRRLDREDGLRRTTADRDGDGAADSVTLLYVRSDGQRVLKQEDYDADGLVDWQKRYVYRADGRRIYEERDRAVDGIADQRWEYLYDEQGRLIWEVITEPGDARCSGIR